MYLDGILIPVPTARRADFRRHAAESAAIFREHGALNVVEAWGDDVPEGRLNSMRTAVLLQDGESVALAFIVWPDRAARDAGMARVAADPRNPRVMAAMPFDGARAIYGGFEVIVDA